MTAPIKWTLSMESAFDNENDYAPYMRGLASNFVIRQRGLPDTRAAVDRVNPVRSLVKAMSDLAAAIGKPETVIIDHGRVFAHATFHKLLSEWGCRIEYAFPAAVPHNNWRWA